MTDGVRRESPSTAAEPGASSGWTKAIDGFAGMIRKVARDRGLDAADVDEVLQDVRVRVWRAAAAQGKAPQVSSSYVYRTAMSAALDLIRRRRGAVIVSDAAAVAAVASRLGNPGHDVAHEELEREVVRALASLPESSQVAVRMHLLGYRRRDIGRHLRWSDGRTRNVLHRALTTVRATLIERGFGLAETA